MIFYKPVDGEIFNGHRHIDYRPRTCFIMTKLGHSVSVEIQAIRTELSEVLRLHDIAETDAGSAVTGRDFLVKIWSMIIAVPFGIAIIDSDMPSQTLANIFYELGMMQAYGKENLVIKTEDADIPSDFVRTEYIEYGAGFKAKLNSYFETFFQIPKHYAFMAESLEKNPLLAIDYLKRAYLITGNGEYRKKAKDIYDAASIKGRSKNSVEALLMKF
jgi:hypothetical protein